MACMYLLEQIAGDVTEEETVYLRQLYGYGRDIMISHSSQHNVLLGMWVYWSMSFLRLMLLLCRIST